MSTLIRCYPGDRNLDFLLVVTLAVALVSSAAWLISRLLAGKAALRHLVLFSALICCLASPAVAWFFAATGLTLVSIPILPGEQGGMPSGVPQIETDPVWMPPRQSTDPPPVAVGLPLPHTNTTIDQSADVAVPPAANESPATSMPSAPDVHRTGSLARTLVSFRGIATGAMFVWAAGALLMLARLARNCGRVVLLRRSSRPVQSEQLQALLSEIAARLGTRQVPLLLVSSRAVTPLAVGFGRPAVILPERLLGAVSDNELRDVLMHEAAHLQRGDQRIVLLQVLAGALYWPIVSVHALNRELRRAREEVCDNIVLAGRNAISYGETLLHVAALLVNARPMRAAVGIIGGRGKFERRISGLINPRRNTMTTTGRRTACFVMFMFLAASAIASATRFAASASEASTPTDNAAQAAPPIDKPQTAQDFDAPKFAGHFSGQVKGPDGKPLSGARIFVIPRYPANMEVGPVRAKTGADGRFQFVAPDMTYTEVDGLPARRQGLLIVTAEGYAPDWFHFWGQENGGHWDWNRLKGADVNLQLAKDDVPIHGRFLDPAGRPLAGARVRFYRLMIPRKRDLDAHLARAKKASPYSMTDYERSLAPPQIPGLTTETRTDADGRFTFTGLGRDRLAELSLSAPSVVDTTLTVMTRATPDVGTIPYFNEETRQVVYGGVSYGAGFTLQLKRALTIKGLVRDRDTHVPIPGMWVAWARNPFYESSFSADAPVTDEKGRFTISGLDPELLNLEKSRRVIRAYPQPGGQYIAAVGFFERGADVVIECARGIPFRLKLLDEQGKPVEADVEYQFVNPNPQIADLDKPFWDTSWSIMNRAARRADGTYEGHVMPGPGAVLVKTPGRSYRPAHVDPKAFFAPGRTKWTVQERISTYGTNNTLQIGRQNWTDQHDYAAIILVNPERNSAPLQLSATVVSDKPRRVSLIDPDGKPVIGVKTQGLTWFPWDLEPTLRAASFALTKLHPDRARRITFIKEDRQLIGFLMARGDGQTPYTVRMQPWGTVTGRIVDENGNAFPMRDAQGNSTTLSMGHGGLETNFDPDEGEYAHFAFDPMTGFDAEGRFRIDMLVPGQRYSAEIYRGLTGILIGKAFEKLVLRPGEVRDLGDIRMKPSVDAKSGTKPGN